jgi:ABC-type transport system involved in multi-copper enzyme maturation permease subunit
LRSPERQAARQSSVALLLLGKEWRDLLAGRTFWLLLLLLCPLVGYSYVQAVILYGEASKSASQLPEVARSLSPLDGILVPTFGALYLANTFLFPFLAIRALSNEKQTGSLKLLLQLPCSIGIVLAAKIGALAIAWLLMTIPNLTAAALWVFAGGHLDPAEFANLMLGHFLYGGVVTGIALVAAALAESSATAAILTLAITLGFWVLDFAAAGEGGLLKTLSNLSLTTLLRNFERGIFSLGPAFAALAAAAGLSVAAGVLINLKLTTARKFTVTLLTVLAAGGLVAASSQLRLYADASENQRNSFAPADTATLAGLGQRLTILVRLAPEDPRYVDFERNILSKLERTMPDVKVVLESETRTGLFEASSDKYGTILYRYAGKDAESRSTGTGEVLPLIYGLAGAERKAVPPAPVYPGYPLEASPRAAELWFYGILPVLIIAVWIVSQRPTAFRRTPRGARPIDVLPVGRRGQIQGDV